MLKIGDIVKFNGNRNRRTDYLADLESDWSDHSLTESQYSMRVQILEGTPAIIVEMEESFGEILYGLKPVDVDEKVKPYFMEAKDLKEHRV